MRHEELSLRRLHAARNFDGATAGALRLYGGEIFGFLVALQRSEAEAGEAFSMFAEKLWRTMDRFEWQCSLRSWAYQIARSVASDERRARVRRERRQQPMLAESDIAALAARIRTETATFLRTEVKDEIARLREALSPEDRELLILRVDRDLAWNDLARTFLGGNGAEDPAVVAREAARLRKRFQTVKDRLIAMAKERGLFDDGG